MQTARKICLWLSPVVFMALLAAMIMVHNNLWQPAAVCLAVCLSIGIGAVPALKGYQYTAWIITAVVAGMIYPGAFTHWGAVDLRNKWLILLVVQMVMFGMGIQMSLRDFSGLGSTGRGVLIGLVCHFSIMPLTGLLLTKVFHFDTEDRKSVV